MRINGKLTLLEIKWFDEMIYLKLNYDHYTQIISAKYCNVTWLRKTVSNTGKEKWRPTTSEVVFNANDEFYFNVSYFVRTCWTSTQNTVYGSFFCNRKAELVIQRTNCKTLKINDRINILLSISKTLQK